MSHKIHTYLAFAILFLGGFSTTSAQTSTFSHSLGTIAFDEFFHPNGFVMNAVPIAPPTSYYDQQVVLSTYRSTENAPLGYNSLALNTVTPAGYLNDPSFGAGKFKKISVPLGMIVAGSRIIKDGSDYLILANSGDVYVNPGILIIKVNSSFNLIWAKLYAKGSGNLFTGKDFKVNGNNIIVCGGVFNSSNPTTETPFIMTVDKTTGAFSNGFSYSLPVNCYGGFDAISEGGPSVTAGHFVNPTGQKQLMVTDLNPSTGAVALNYVHTSSNVTPHRIKSYGIASPNCSFVRGWIIAGFVDVPGSPTLKDICIANLTQNLCTYQYTFGFHTISGVTSQNSKEELRDLLVTNSGFGTGTTLDVTAVGTLSFGSNANSLLEMGFVYDPYAPATVNPIASLAADYYPYGLGMNATPNTGIAIQKKNASEVALLGNLAAFSTSNRININSTTNYQNIVFKDNCKKPFLYRATGLSPAVITTNQVLTPTILNTNSPAITITMTNLSQKTDILCTDNSPGGRYANPSLIQSDKTQISPNPATDHLNISIATEMTINKLRVLNINGQVVLAKELNPETKELELDLESLAKGMYILMLEGDGKPEVQKFIKE